MITPEMTREEARFIRRKLGADECIIVSKRTADGLTRRVVKFNPTGYGKGGKVYEFVSTAEAVAAFSEYF